MCVAGDAEAGGVAIRFQRSKYCVCMLGCRDRSGYERSRRWLAAEQNKGNGGGAQYWSEVSIERTKEKVRREFRQIVAIIEVEKGAESMTRALGRGIKKRLT